MPKRPRSHELEDLSRNQLRNIFTQEGWVVWDLYPDYGEDLFVRIFSDQASTQYSFFVQAKATDHIEDYLKEDNSLLSYPIKVDHIELWEHFWEPVLLTVWDAKSNTTYWEIVQDFMQEKAIKPRRKTIKIDIPINNVLTQESLKTILERTQSRFERFEILSEGFKSLANILNENYGIKIDYNIKENIWTLVGDKGLDIVIRGKTADILEKAALEQNIDSEDLLRKIFQNFTAKQLFEDGSVYEEPTKNGGVIIRHKERKSIIIEYETIKEWEEIKNEN